MKVAILLAVLLFTQAVVALRLHPSHQDSLPEHHQQAAPAGPATTASDDSSKAADSSAQAAKKSEPSTDKAQESNAADPSPEKTEEKNQESAVIVNPNAVKKQEQKSQPEVIVNPNAVKKQQEKSEPEVIVNPNAVKKEAQANEPEVIVNPNAAKKAKEAVKEAKSTAEDKYDDSAPSAAVQDAIKGLATKDKVFEKLNNKQKKHAADLLDEIKKNTIPFAPMADGNQQVLAQLKEQRDKSDLDYIKSQLNIA